MEVFEFGYVDRALADVFSEKLERYRNYLITSGKNNKEIKEYARFETSRIWRYPPFVIELRGSLEDLDNRVNEIFNALERPDIIYGRLGWLDKHSPVGVPKEKWHLYPSKKAYEHFKTLLRDQYDAVKFQEYVDGSKLVHYRKKT
ncbi:MAG: hypothetical protein V1743_00910 [Nanoarchaeota archaeon]